MRNLTRALIHQKDDDSFFITWPACTCASDDYQAQGTEPFKSWDDADKRLSQVIDNEEDLFRAQQQPEMSLADALRFANDEPPEDRFGFPDYGDGIDWERAGHNQEMAFAR